MLLGFKRRFAPFVLDGSKTHTIRGLRKDGLAPKVGMTCHCYVDPRQRTMALLGRWPFVRAEDIRIYTRADGTFGVTVNRDELSLEEKNLLAHRDGFRSDWPFFEMMRFWIDEHGHGQDLSRVICKWGSRPLFVEPRLAAGIRGIDFEGQIIHWRFDAAARNARWREILKRIGGKR
jgi:hypothetical protein